MSESLYPWSKGRSNYTACLDMLLPNVLPDQLRAAAKKADGIKYPSEAEVTLTNDLIILAAKKFDGETIQAGDWLDAGIGRPFRVAGSHPTDDPWVVELQPGTAPDHGYYLFGGGASYSGSLEHPVTVQVEDVPLRFMMAWFWIFWCGRGGASCGVQFKLPARVFKVKLLQGRWPRARERNEFRYSYDDPIACWRQ